MHPLARIAGAILGILLFSITTANADDWVAVKLRGEVVQLVGDKWLPLKRYDVVPDDRAIRTGHSGHVVFERDAETVEMSWSTQIRIHDRVGTRFTVVEEHFGTVTVEAEVQNVQHFAVETPFLAAVVKGTKFSVKTSKTGSTVKVTRGRVAVEAKADGSTVLIKAGQNASVSANPSTSGPALAVGGRGLLPKVVEGAGNGVNGIINGVAAGVSGVVGGVGNLAGDAVEGVGDVVDGVDDVVGGVVGGVGNLLGHHGQGGGGSGSNSGPGSSNSGQGGGNSGQGGNSGNGGLVGGLLGHLL